MKKESNLIKSTFVIMIVSVISRALGLIRDMLIGKSFGAGMYTDAYNIAVSVPETIFALIGLAISTAFLPTLSKIKAKKGQKEMYDFANNVINILFPSKKHLSQQKEVMTQQKVCLLHYLQNHTFHFVLF